MRITRVTTVLAAGGIVAAALPGAPTPGEAAPGHSTRAAAPAQTPITAAELPGLGGPDTIPLDIDASGRVVGESDTAAGSTHAVLWLGGRPVDLTPTLPSGATGRAQGIGDNGRIVGFLDRALPDGGGPGVVTWLAGRMTTLSAPPAAGDEAVDINNNDQILYRDGGRSYLWRNGTTTAVPDVAPGVPLQVADINEWGLVVGTSQPADPENRRAYSWLPGLPPTPVGTLGGSWSEAVAVNDRGQVTGFSGTAAGQRRMFITQGSNMVDLGTLGGDQVDRFGFPPGSLAPRLVNNLGHVVGLSTTASGANHAFLWRDGRMIDLGPGFATGLNDLDQVVGAGAGEGFFVDAVVRQDGHTFDLGRLTTPDRLLSVATVVNNRGQAIGPTPLIPTLGGTRAWLWTVPRVTAP